MVQEIRNGVHYINIDSIDGFIGKSTGEESKMLYKYMPLDKAIKTLKKSELWLANPIEWDDPFEKLLLTAQFRKKSPLVNYDFPYKDRLFATCLTRDSESEANWKVYSREQIGVLFKVKVEALVKELESFAKNNKNYTVIIGKVEYKKEEEIRKRINTELQNFKPGTNGTREQCAELMLLKRNAFKSDNEIRIIVINNEEKIITGLKGIPIGFKDKTQLFPSIKIAPNVDQDVVEMIRCYFENQLEMTKRVLKNGVIRTRIERSKLKDKAQIITIDI